MNLSSLPKDLLIKIIQTIETDTRIEITQEIRNEITQEIEEKYAAELYKCKNMLTNIFSKYSIDIFTCNSCDQYELYEPMLLNFCLLCHSDCCNAHSSKIDGEVRCLKCAK